MNSNRIAPVANIRFSVIIPAYNAQQTIAKTLDSVLAQSYPAFEIIVVDDASTDRTCDLLEDKYGSQALLIKKLYNGGSSIARNTGMDAATGDYIAFIDADDMWHPDKLMVMNTIITSTPGIKLLYHLYTLDNIMNNPVPENITLYRLPFVKLLPGNIISTSCLVLINNPSFRFDPSMRYTEDYDLCLRIGYKHKLYFTDIYLTQLLRKITSKGGISEHTWKMRKGELRAYSHLLGLNPLFFLLLPFLFISSIAKHLYKMIFKR